MPRLNVTKETQREIAETIIQPFHIAEIHFETASTFVSEGPEVSHDGSEYLADSLEVKGVMFDEDGFQKAGLSLLDYNGGAIALALQNKITDTPCTLYLVYRKADGTDTVTELATGVLEPENIDEFAVGLTLLPQNSASRFYPDKRVNRTNGFNHLTKSGRVIEWGEEKFQLVN